MNNNIIVSALRAKLEAEKAEGLAILSVYTNSSVGVGEHPSVVGEAFETFPEILEMIDDGGNEFHEIPGTISRFKKGINGFGKVHPSTPMFFILYFDRSSVNLIKSF